MGRIGAQAVGVSGAINAPPTDRIAHLSDAAIVGDPAFEANHSLLAAVPGSGRTATLPRTRGDAAVNGLRNANFIKAAITTDVAFYAAV
jgi:hypothetical protein